MLGEPVVVVVGARELFDKDRFTDGEVEYVVCTSL